MPVPRCQRRKIARSPRNRRYQTALRSHVVTESGAAYDVEGRVISLIPLRNRRTTPEGKELTTRITEGMTEYRCDGQVGYGLSEYLDQIVDGRPSGTDFPADALG